MEFVIRRKDDRGAGTVFLRFSRAWFRFLVTDAITPYSGSIRKGVLTPET
jgi:hypothetical protein